jgi:hypothetical protein
MTPAVFVKRYNDPARCAAAHAHLRWLQQLGSGVRLPHLNPGTASHLVLERLDGRAPEPENLPGLAAVLGRLHGTAYARELHAARLDQPFHTRYGVTIPDFYTGRRHALAKAGVDPSGLPAAVYKDANHRNFIVTTNGVAIVDFDDLTLAPFGYDLAKLVVSTSMTFGAPTRGLVGAALATYTRGVEATGGPAGSCSAAQLARYAEVHHLLTAKYLHRNGYQHPWPTVRPWPVPTARPL